MCDKSLWPVFCAPFGFLVISTTIFTEGIIWKCLKTRANPSICSCTEKYLFLKGSSTNILLHCTGNTHSKGRSCVCIPSSRVCVCVWIIQREDVRKIVARAISCKYMLTGIDFPLNSNILYICVFVYTLQ